MIPKIFHYVWIGPYTEQLGYRDSWQQVMPDYKLKIWDNQTVKPYIAEALSYFGMDHLRDKSMTYISDILRLMILRDHGGVYLDHDIMVLRDFTKLLEGKKFVASFQYDPAFANTPDVYTRGQTLKDDIIHVYDKINYHSDTVNNCFIASVAYHPMLNDALYLTKVNHFKPKVSQYAMSDWTVGPATITDAARHWGLKTSQSKTVEYDGVCIYHRDHFHPVHGTDRNRIGQEAYDARVQQIIDQRLSYAIHYHQHFGTGMYVKSELKTFGGLYESGLWQ